MINILISCVSSDITLVAKDAFVSLSSDRLGKIDDKVASLLAGNEITFGSETGKERNRTTGLPMFDTQLTSNGLLIQTSKKSHARRIVSAMLYSGLSNDINLTIRMVCK